MKTMLLLVLVVACNLPAQEEMAKAAFEPFTAPWQGRFRVFNFDGKLLDELQIEQRYWWEGEVQHAKFIERNRDGRLVTAKARNYVENGKLYCEVEKDSGEKTVHLGHYENGMLFWYRKTADGKTVESFKERVVAEASGKVYYIDGFGVYGQGAGASYLLFEGRYEEVKE